MLVLSRRPGERILIDEDVTVTVVSIQGDRVKLGFECPDHVHILRAELRERDLAHSDSSRRFCFADFI